MRKLNIIPYPKSVEFTEDVLDVSSLRLAGAQCFAAEDFIAYLKTLPFPVEITQTGCPVSYMQDNSIQIGEEGYILDISPNGIDLKVSAEKGLLYAFCTLKQLIFNYKGKLPCCVIRDEPDLKFRALMLDSGRYFFRKEDVFKIIDLGFLHKLNVFHWHLTEDQGWRIEIEKYPLLTQKGSRRSHTNFGILPHGGYYTKADVKEIIRYANQRGMQVIPEIDMPGHMQSAIACYPELSCFDRELDVATHWGVKHDVLCAGKESTYRFVFDVLEEVIDLFGGNTKYIHFGSDEVFKHRWEFCEHCQKAMRENGLETTDELHAHFMRKVCGWIRQKGMIPIAWSGVNSTQIVDENLILQLWSDEQGVKDDATRFQIEQGGGYINSSSKYLYVDFPYGMISLKESYGFEPEIKEFAKEKLIGADVTLWTEYVPNFGTACKRLLPRLCALSEKMWSQSPKDYADFRERLNLMLSYLKAAGYNHSSLCAVDPGALRGALQKLWFNKRVLHWQGLHNLIDDAYVERKYGKYKKK